jgi:hypothetical protein
MEIPMIALNQGVSPELALKIAILNFALIARRLTSLSSIQIEHERLPNCSVSMV